MALDSMGNNITSNNITSLKIPKCISDIVEEDQESIYKYYYLF